MRRIQGTKDDLLHGSCSWVFENRAFQDWWDQDDTNILWIHGDAGKGKTMMMIALIEEILHRTKEIPGSGLVSYFFCQSGNSSLNNAVAVLRGLIFLLVIQEENLMEILQKKYNEAGSALFEAPNTFYSLSRILLDLLENSSFSKVYLMIDALDECDIQQRELLQEIARRTGSCKVKWLTTSRNEERIKEELEPCCRGDINLESNSLHVSKAVDYFIGFKVDSLAIRKKYSDELKIKVMRHLSGEAHGTFLWVALVCKELEVIPKRRTEAALEKFPAGLGPLYDRILAQIHDNEEDYEICKRILRLITIAFRPLHVQEIVTLGEILQEQPYDLDESHELITMCGSFVTIREDQVYFVHKSAKDYFSTGKGSKIFPSGQAEEHGRITCRSLKLLSDSLKRDICGLQVPGALLDNVESDINQNLLAQIRYACRYWVEHLCQVSRLQEHQILISDEGGVHKFLLNHFLHWLEALSLMGKMSDGVIMVRTLESKLTVSDSVKPRDGLPS
jgi:hypothetical protein